MNKLKALYIIGSIGLPRVDAGASRILELSQGFKSHFDKIIIAGRSDMSLHELHDADEKISFLPYHRINSNGLIDKIRMIFFPTRFFINDLQECLEKFDVTHILIYSAIPVSSLKKIRKIAIKHRIKLVFDVVEYQTASKQTLASFFSFYLPNIHINKHGIKKENNVISISTYLNNYFTGRGIKSNFIPFVFDAKQTTSYLNKESNNDKLTLLYAGNPKKGKDSLSSCIRGLSLLSNDEKNRVQLSIAGVSLKNIFKRSKLKQKDFEKTRAMVKYLGKLSNDEIESLYKDSDFSILVRDPNCRLSKAGFPTKVSESLVHGVPVICNISSDLDSYLEDGYNSLVMKDDSPREFARCISLALKMNKEELSSMRINARKTAETKLDVSLFSQEINRVFNQ